MTSIEVPYLPVNRFDPLDISEKFSGKPEEIKINDEVKPTRQTLERNELNDVELVLLGIGMGKYLELIQEKGIELDILLQLDETDLENLGISDPKDRKVFIENLSSLHNKKSEFVIPEDHEADFKILCIIQKELKLLQSYCAYVDLQLTKQNLTDYQINEEETACTYLKAFTQTALTQSQIMRKRLYDQYSSDSLYDKLLKVNNLKFKLLDGLPKKRNPKRVYFLNFMTLIGLYVTGKLIIRLWNYVK